MIAAKRWKGIIWKTLMILLLVTVAGPGLLNAQDDDTDAGPVYLPEPQGGNGMVITIAYDDKDLQVEVKIANQNPGGVTINALSGSINLVRIPEVVKDLTDPLATPPQVRVKARDNGEVVIYEAPNGNDITVDGKYRICTKLNELKDDTIGLEFTGDTNGGVGLALVWTGKHDQLSEKDLENFIFSGSGTFEIVPNDGNLALGDLIEAAFKDNLEITSLIIYQMEKDRNGKTVAKTTMLIRRCAPPNQPHAGIGTPADMIVIEGETVRFTD